MMIQSTPLENIGKPTVFRTTATVTATIGGGMYTIQKVYDLGSNGGVVQATATNGLGDSVSQEATITVTGNYASGVSATLSGICTDCKKTCFLTCHGVCLGTTVPGYVNDCRVNCIGQCRATCYGGCKDSCKNGCQGECLATCKGYCVSCGGACESGCTYTCTSCSGSGCTTNCGTNCRKNGGGGCFTEHTRVLTGKCTYKNIEDIKIGDTVIAYDENNKIYSAAKVTKTQCFTNKADIIEIEFSNGIIILTTTSHPFLTTSGWKALDIEMAEKEHCIHVDLLQINDEVITDNNEHVFVVNITAIPSLAYTLVYNIDVLPYHTYLVENIVVHNAYKKDTQ